MTLTVGIVGNPNCGKTTLFNELTGARQRVGNWPGVTVEQKRGRFRDGERTVEVVDLPGVYTLGVVPGMESLDEKIARDWVLSGEADVVINIVDASNLERNLYLTAQLVEMQVPMVVALNMMDAAREHGLEVDATALAARLGCPVVAMVAARGEGVGALKEAVFHLAMERKPPTIAVAYHSRIEALITRMLPVLGEVGKKAGINPRLLAVRRLEGDDLACGYARGTCEELLERHVADIEAELGEDMDILIADGRYAFANHITRAVARRVGEASRSISDAIDRVVLGPWLGLPIFLALMYVMFMFTINLGGAFVDFFDLGAKALFVDGVGEALSGIGTPVWIKVLVADGIGGGIQVVATFIPIIGFLYLFLSVLEDSGYMARAAFLMDRLMRLIGLPGKSFVPLIVGFGCNVPAIMATRTLDQQRDRIMAVLMTPFMSCGARLAVYALFAAAFFPVGGQNVVFVLYLAGVLVAIATGFVLKHTLLRGETTPFVMELPPYHVPRLKGVLIHAWARLKSFVFGAGQIIVIVVVALSFLNSWGTDGSFGNEDSDKSVLSAVGRAIVPLFQPLGIRDDNWPATVGIFTGVFAKEAVVGTLDALYSSLAGEGRSGGPEEPGLWNGLVNAAASVPSNLARIGTLFTDPLGIESAKEKLGEVSTGTFGAMAARFDGEVGALAYLLFILLYTPCVATLGAVTREIGSRWMLFATAWTTGVAYALAVTFYQGLTFARHPGLSALWIMVMVAAAAAAITVMRRLGRRPPPRTPDLAPAE